MTHRTDRMYLPPDSPRCTALAAPCKSKQNCARYMATLPEKNAILDDFSNRQVGWGWAQCPWYTVSAHRPVAAPVEAKPWPSV